MTDMIECTCGYSQIAENNDPDGRMLNILKDIHEMTFQGHRMSRREATAADFLIAEQRKAAKKKK